VKVREVHAFDDLKAVVIFCSLIGSCKSQGKCRAFRRVARKHPTAVVITCLNPKYHNTAEARTYAERAVKRELTTPTKEVQPSKKPIRVGRPW